MYWDTIKRFLVFSMSVPQWDCKIQLPSDFVRTSPLPSFLPSPSFLLFSPFCSFTSPLSFLLFPLKSLPCLVCFLCSPLSSCVLPSCNDHPFILTRVVRSWKELGRARVGRRDAHWPGTLYRTGQEALKSSWQFLRFKPKRKRVPMMVLRFGRKRKRVPVIVFRFAAERKVLGG